MRKETYCFMAALLMACMTLGGCDDDGVEAGYNYLADGMIVDSTGGTSLCYVENSNEPGTMMVTWHREQRLGTEGYTYSGDVVIPEKIVNQGQVYRVTGIDTWAFALSPITGVTIPECISYIGEESFAKTSIKKVKLPGNTTAIPNGSFAGSKLTSFAFGDSIESIGTKAFIKCTSLSTLTFGTSSRLTSVGDYAFYGCTKLQKLTLPATVTSIGSYAFCQCSKLTELHLLSSVPPQLSDSIVTSSVSLYVPTGSKSAYESDKNWAKFASITEE